MDNLLMDLQRTRKESALILGSCVFCPFLPSICPRQAIIVSVNKKPKVAS